MKGRLPDQNQRDLFQPNLNQIINPAHEISLLADKIDWNYFENEFTPLYSHTGAPAKPIRLMISLLLLKHMFDHGDETVMIEWVQNPYYQYFSGMSTFQWKYPCDPSDLVHFRNRIEQSGVEKIFKHSVQIHGLQALEYQVTVDTTVQETNVAFPTDTRLQVKMIKSCVKIADEVGITLRQRYPRKLKRLLIQARFGHHPRRRKEANSAKRQIKTIAVRLERNFYKGIKGDQLNVLLACASWNLKKLMKKLLQAFSWPVFRILLRSVMHLEQRFSGFFDILIMGNARNTGGLSLDERF